MFLSREKLIEYWDNLVEAVQVKIYTEGSSFELTINNLEIISKEINRRKNFTKTPCKSKLTPKPTVLFPDEIGLQDNNSLENNPVKEKKKPDLPHIYSTVKKKLNPEPIYLTQIFAYFNCWIL